MAIHEDKDLFSESPVTDEKEILETAFGNETERNTNVDEALSQPSQEKPSPGTRIIYEAPDKNNRRDYTGFSVEKFQSESPFVSQNSNKEKNENTRTGGQAFEQKLREKNAYPQKRPVPKAVAEEKIDEKEILRRRYIEYKKSGNLPKAEDVAIDDIDSMEVEEIYVDPPAKKKKPGAGEIVRRCVLAVSLVAMVISIGVLLNQYIQYKENQQLTEDLNSLIITDAPTTEKNNKPEDDEPATEESTTRPLTVEEQWALLKSENPDVVFPAGIQLKYAKFYAINQDFVGYISIDELGVGLPVLQSEEKEYYLRRNIYKKNSKYGCPFVPTENDMVSLDRNTVIYGHNMSDGSVFAPLNKYKSLSGFKSAPIIQFDTIYGTYKWKIIAAFLTNADKEDDDGYVFPYNFTKLQSDADFMKYIELLKERSLYDTGVDVISSDKILTLSTCAYDFDSARFVVVARMVRPGESAEVDTSMAKENENPHYPQAWYGKKKKDKKKNPYRDAEKWYYYGE
ncbi:MAG: class B sortase [Clostridia bacterium]|nr:class B sortase [Clostridia bacterium]